MPFSLNRRHFALGSAGLALAGLIPGAAFAQQPTRTVTTSLGTVDIPVDPKRVACIDSRLDMQPAIALGLNVIGYSHSEPGPWVPKPAGAEFYGAPLALEQVLASNPDLIICADYDPAGEWWPADKLKAIAPVIPTISDTPWKDQFRGLATLLGMEGKGEAAIAEYDTLVADIKARHGDKLASKGIVSLAPQEGTVYLMNGSTMLQPQVLADLGCKTIAPAEGQLYDGGEIAGENLAAVLGDCAGLLLATTSPDDLASIADNPLWQRLPAIASGAYVESNGNINYGSIYSAMQVARLVDEIYSKIA